MDFTFTNILLGILAIAATKEVVIRAARYTWKNLLPFHECNRLHEDVIHMLKMNAFRAWHMEFETWVTEYYKAESVKYYSGKMRELQEKIEGRMGSSHSNNKGWEVIK